MEGERAYPPFDTPVLLRAVTARVQAAGELPSLVTPASIFDEIYDGFRGMTLSDRTSNYRPDDVLTALRQQARLLWPLIAMIYTPVVIALGIVVVVRIVTGIAMADFTRDPLMVVEGDPPVYTGSLSIMCGLIWAGTATVCLFGWSIARTRSAEGTRPSFLLAAGIITIVLFLDDVYLGHEIVYPQYIGLPEEILYSIYGIGIVGFLVAFRSTILQSEFLLLGLALAGFGFSIFMDAIPSSWITSLPGTYLLEDGSKIFGLVSWAAYFTRVSYRYVTSDTRRVADESPVLP